MLLNAFERLRIDQRPQVGREIAGWARLELARRNGDPEGLTDQLAQVRRDLATASDRSDAPADAIATASFLDLGTRRPGGVADTPPAELFDAHDVHLEPLPRPITRVEFERIIDGLPSSTLRAKGIAVTPDGTRLLAQVVGRRRCVTELPDAEAQPPTDLVVITPRGAPIR